MRLLVTFARRYPAQSAAVVMALLVGGIVEGIGISTLVPILSVAIDSMAAGQSGVSTELAADASGIAYLVPETLRSIGITPTVGVLLTVMVIGIALKSLLGLIAYKEVGYTIANIATDLRLTLIRALLSARWEYYVHQPIGSLANAVGTEAIRASQAYYHGARVIAYALQALVYAAVAIAVSWQATVIALIGGSALLSLFNFLVRATRRAGTRQTKLLKSLLAQLTDGLRSVKPLKSMAREELVGPVLHSQNELLKHALQREVLTSEALRAVQEPMLALFIAVGLYFAVVTLSVPPAAVLALIFLLSRALFQAGKVQRVYQNMAVSESAFWSLTDAIEVAEGERETATGSRAPTLTRGIKIEGAEFSYDKRKVLKNVSMTIPAGSFCAIVGESGSGKTTIVDMVTGLLRPENGQLWIDDVPLQEIDLTAWRRMIGYVPQETGLLHDSVLNNVTLGDASLTEEDARFALQAAGASEFVESLPEGLHSSVGERGASLSGGQRQRIVIARALAHKPALLILDEATSALDEKREMEIYDTLAELHSTLTVLAISHRPNIERLADLTYHLHDGVTQRHSGDGLGQPEKEISTRF